MPKTTRTTRTTKTTRKTKPTVKPKAGARPKPHIHYHRDGSIWAKGKLLKGVATGYWEWFRKSGIRMRSGYFEEGVQVGVWTTYDKSGEVCKVTIMKPKPR